MSAFVRFACVLALALSAFAFAQPSPATSPVTFPLAFEANHGQTAPQVRYLARSHEGTLFFTDAGVTIAVPLTVTGPRALAAAGHLNHGVSRSPTQAQGPRPLRASALDELEPEPALDAKVSRGDAVVER